MLPSLILSVIQLERVLTGPAVADLASLVLSGVLQVASGARNIIVPVRPLHAPTGSPGLHIVALFTMCC